MTELSATQLSGLPKFVEDHEQWVVEVPARIIAIILISLIVRALLHRAIDRMVRPVRGGGVPRILRPFKERIESSAFLESTGLMSERRAQRAATIGSICKSVVSLVILVIAVMLILSELEVDLAPFIAGTSVVGVAIGFGAQNVIKDFLAGIFMTLEDQYGVGDTIDFQLASGTVEAVGLRTTRLRDVNGTVWYVRNGEVLRVGNKSQGFAQVVLDVPIDASAEIDKASQAIQDEAERMRAEDDWSPLFLGDPEMQGVESMTREEVVLRLVARVRPGEQWRTARELRRRVRERLDRLDIPAHEPSTSSPPADPAGAGGAANGSGDGSHS